MAPAKKQKKGAPPTTAAVRKPKKGGHHNRAANAAAHRAAQREEIARIKRESGLPAVERRPNGSVVVVQGEFPRPTKYDEEIGRKICLMFATDTKMTLGRLDADPTMPTAMTFYDWLTTEPTFEKCYARARDIQFDKQAEELAEISANPLLGTITVERNSAKDGLSTETRTHDNVDRARLMVDTRKWLLSKQRPKKYGLQPVDVEDNNALKDLLTQFRVRNQQLGENEDGS